ncbi:MAG: ribonuclease III domain-containing protein [Candidatus Izemoplasmatales bacterium]|nr:ribonuclease III domain-containing protein [Candidatus Izemoplasmatales bacterium]
MKNLSDHLDDVQRQISYWFDNIDLLFQAFTRRSYSEENGGENNEVLEFIGDRVLDFYVTKILMDRYGYTKSQLDDFDADEDDDEFVVDTYTNEGSLTAIKKKLVKKKMLAHRIDKLGFKDFLRMGNGDIQQHKENEDSVKEDLFEAILGAIAIDSNWNTDELENVVDFMLNMDHFLTHGLTEEDDYVGLVQQWNQKENGEVPEYEFEEIYSGGFKAYLSLDTPRGTMRYYAEGNSKAEARANVAEFAYNDLDEHDELFTIMDELPEELTLENSINTLQELAQKGYVSMPEYYLPEDQVYDYNGNPRWMCTCTIRSHALEEIVYATSKKTAKKYAAYLCICNICGLKDQFQDE